MAQSKKITPGTWVRMKGNPLNLLRPLGVVVNDDGSGAVMVETDSGQSLLSRQELLVLNPQPQTRFLAARKFLPYGYWTCADGREVMFNRDYQPIWQRYDGGPAERADSAERVDYQHQGYFYEGAEKPWKNRELKRACLEILAAWQVSDLPQ